MLPAFVAEAERIDVLLSRARDSGAMRADIGRAELHLLVAGNAGVIAASAPADAPAASRRYVDLVLRSFEAAPS